MASRLERGREKPSMPFLPDMSDRAGTPIPLGPMLAEATRFKSLFADGMRLVEEAANYLDGAGREDARGLSAALADVYAAESMRLTTRLMQLASWLLIHKAVADGELTAGEAVQDQRKSGFSPQSRATPNGLFLQLPFPLQRLTERSLRLQRRVVHLDRMINTKADGEPPAPPAALAEQHDRLRKAYGLG